LPVSERSHGRLYVLLAQAEPSLRRTPVTSVDLRDAAVHARLVRCTPAVLWRLGRHGRYETSALDLVATVNVGS
jgi:hypothetical protein